MNSILAQTLILIPAFNEEASLPDVIAGIRQVAPDSDIVVINDCSGDRTAAAARRAGAAVLDLPCNLGVGGAVQAGFRYAHDRGYSHVLRCDGDGQHPPSEIPKLAAAMEAGLGDLIIGSRFLAANGNSFTSTAWRSAGIHALARLLSIICRARVTDPTSGFQMLNRPLLRCFAHCYPVDYPEPESLALLRRQGYTFHEVPAVFRARQGGTSSIQSWGAFYYLLKVGLALVVDRARTVDPRLARHNTIQESP